MVGCWWLGLGLAGVLLALTVYLWLKRRLGYFARRGVPYVALDSIFQHNVVSSFSPRGKSFGELFDEMYRKLKSDENHRGYGGFFHLYTPSYLLTSAEMVRSVTVENFLHFNDHGLPTDDELNPLEGNLFLLSGPKWRALRKKLTPTFTSGKLKWMFSLIAECGERLVATLEKEADTGKEVEMREMLARFTTDVIGSCAFGIDSESLKDPESRFRQMGRKVFKPPLSIVLKSIARSVMPSLFKVLQIRTSQADVDDFFMSTISQALEHRLKTGAKRNDLVQLLLQLRETGSIDYEQDDPMLLPGEIDIPDDGDSFKLELTDGLLAAQATIFFIAGFETTASAMSYSVYLLARHQDVQDKARREVEEVVAKHRGKMSYDALKEMVYLEACINESMRLYPPIQILPRVCTKDFTMEDGNVILKKQAVIIPIFSLHRDPEYFEDPLEFRPERFMPGAPPPKPGAFIPFGYGPRICIAQRFALLEVKLCLAMMLASFKFALGPSMKEPLELVTQLFVNAPKDGVKLLVKSLD